MKIPVISAVLLSALAVTALAEELPVGGEPEMARATKADTANRGQIGTQFTDRVMRDVSSKVADSLEIKLEREMGGTAAVRANSQDKLLVSTN